MGIIQFEVSASLFQSENLPSLKTASCFLNKALRQSEWQIRDCEACSADWMKQRILSALVKMSWWTFWQKYETSTPSTRSSVCIGFSWSSTHLSGPFSRSSPMTNGYISYPITICGHSLSVACFCNDFFINESIVSQILMDTTYYYKKN